MKTIILTLGILISVNFQSCSVSIDENLNSQYQYSKRIVNLWYLKKQFVNGVEQNLSECNNGDFFDIATNNQLIFYNYTLNGVDCVTSVEYAQWSISKTHLTIDWSVDNTILTEQLEILELTDSTFRFKKEVEGLGTLEEIYSETP